MIQAKHVQISINKEQRFPAVSNFNGFDDLTMNICLGSHKVCKTYWKHIFHTEFCLHLDPVEIKVTNHVIKKGI